MLSLMLFLNTSLSVSARAELISTGVGTLRGHVMTSREVQIQNHLEGALYARDDKDKARMLSLDSKAFGKAVQDALLEAAIALEAQSFNVVKVTAEEVKGAEKNAMTTLKALKSWKDLKASPAEIQKGIERKLQAKKFVQFRAQSSVLPVTDSEAQKYFTENRLKFGTLPFENFKENIKSYLSRAQVERRLKDWYDVLLNKYQVKNLIAEI